MMSYFVMGVRNFFVFSLVTGDDSSDFVVWLCDKNFRMALFNLICDVLTELIPYCIIFILNFNNFREIDKHEQLLRKQFSELQAPNYRITTGG